MRRQLIVAAALTLLAFAPFDVPAVHADPPPGAGSGPAFSQHVRSCQREMGFTGTHNPGVMHQGLSGWDPGHTC